MNVIVRKESDSLTSPLIQQRIIRSASDNVPSDSQSFNSSGVKSIGTGSYLIDARLFSEGIKTSRVSTSESLNKLIDSAGVFNSFSLEKGDWVRNTTTNKYAYIVSIDSNNQITLTKDIFSSGDGYEISNGFME